MLGHSSGFPSFCRLNDILLYTLIYTTFYLFICWWTLGLFPSFGYCEQRCYEHGFTNISLSSQFQFLWMYTKSEIPGSYDNSAFNFLRNPHNFFHSGCTILYSHQQYTRIPVPPHPDTCFLSFTCNNKRNANYNHTEVSFFTYQIGKDQKAW